MSYIDLDGATGLPAGGTTPTPVPFLTGTGEVWGVAVDPTTGYIWATIWTPDFEPHLLVIGAPIFSDGFESGDTSEWYTP